MAKNPGTTDCCDTMYCFTCFLKGLLISPWCDVCLSHPSDPRSHELEWKRFQKPFAMLYAGLKIKCTLPDCDEELTVANYEEHDANCPFKSCQICQFPRPGVHDCIQWLLEENSKLKSGTDEVKNLKDQLRDVISERDVLKSGVQDLEKEKKILHDTFNATLKMVSSVIGSKITETNGCNQPSPDMESDTIKDPIPRIGKARSCMRPFMYLPRALRGPKVVKQPVVQFVESLTTADVVTRDLVKETVESVFQDESNKMLNIQEKCYEVSKLLMKSWHGQWYTFPRKYFNPFDFRAHLDSFCLFSYNGKYYVIFRNDATYREKVKFLGHYFGDEESVAIKRGTI